MSDDSTKAVGRSISFRPFSLYEKAEQYGNSLRPPRSVSSVVCEALEDLLRNRGVDLEPSNDDAEVLAKTAAFLKARPDSRSDLEAFIRSKTRQRRKAA